MFLKVGICIYQLWLIMIEVARANDVVYEDGPIHYDQLPCGQFFCNQTTQECINNMSCECKPQFEYNPDDGHCHICPSDGHFCISCCFGGAVCHAGRCQHCWKDQNGDCMSQDSIFFITAAQFALVTAMVLGILALGLLLYKTCRARTRRNAQPSSENEISRFSLSRISLTSIQVRVLRRLRDRPPKYETRHNYEFNRRERSQASPRRHTTTPVSRQSGLGDPPPAYDGDTASVVDIPPPYSVDLPHTDARITVPVQQSIANVVDRSGEVIENGVDNKAFENTEVCEVKHNEHKVIHI
ncbi:uncharacterized protein LOC129776102 isoform X2 [Toxorhynchites rutilus septentrionalis]|uniref:uncharacterized protein LOC129776102 isoform X2 n=1 Tax=Toxorhynchites rutilus septentrionalis TaxID=329112 RepID=UPI00247ADE02|nr:uncharacterized protein LOC129776102 isoform X2 [Toxorhynchites rutilus septentrionalis]